MGVPKDRGWDAEGRLNGHTGRARPVGGGRLDEGSDLARRSVVSISWNVVANTSRILILFVRSVMLARLLPVEVFGVYALAGSVIGLTKMLPGFGMWGAFLHRAPETEDEAQAAAVHFTLKLLFTLLWTVLLIGGALSFTAGETRLALLVLVLATGGTELSQTPRLILMRRVMHQRLALIQMLNALLTTAVALGLAWRGATLWALLATDLVTFLLHTVALYIWRPVWRPRLAWSPPVVRYFLRFGSRNLVGAVLLRALDRLDDLWTGVFLGKSPLGFYSRAYTFATYPRGVLAAPVNQVTTGMYAELKGDRRRLSQAFFRVNAFLVRSGFLFAGVLWLIAPEFVRLLLGDKWLPMLTAFRLMLVFTLFDPMKVTIANLFIAMGRPEQVVWARAVQLAVMVGGLFLLGLPFGIAGVALAVDLMLVVGIVLLFWMARAYVDCSVGRLFAAPGMALAVGGLLGYGMGSLSAVTASGWTSGLAKVMSFTVVYGSVLLALERRRLLEMVSEVRRSLLSKQEYRSKKV
ncbi:MAG TPA: hypothetical protein ENK08_09395 [Chloroflexi bacterium]|nr:hypothetical protein [Chloroflexota bacterium]